MLRRVIYTIKEHHRDRPNGLSSGEALAMKRYKCALVIGRFQPFHIGHRDLIEQAKRHADEVIILIGSTNGPRTTRNPFTFAERVEMIGNYLGSRPGSTRCFSLPDHTYDLPAWQANVQRIVESVVGPSVKDSEIAIVGTDKDPSTYYLKLFPQWDLIQPDEVRSDIDSTRIRAGMFTDTCDYSWMEPMTARLVAKFCTTEDFRRLKEEHAFIVRYRAAMRYVGAPYEPSMQTVDAVVVQGGHVLLVKRKGHPGMGLGALPGGFVSPGETLMDAMVRELVEETSINVPEQIIRSSIVHQQTFDDPHRDQRGRVYSQAFLVDLDSELENRLNRWGRSKSGLAKVKGGDDAAKASWIPISKLDPMKMFADHYHIIQKLLGFKR